MMQVQGVAGDRDAVVPLLPWGYIYSNYLKKPADRWR